GLQIGFYDTDAIDFNYNEDFKNGEHVRFGVHFYPSGKRKGYWFIDTKVYDRRSFVPADEIIHEFIVLKALQKRGLPWASTALLRLNMLGGYEEAALVNARTGASKMGFYTSPDGDATIGELQDDGSLVATAEPGTFEQLPAGVEFNSYDPAYPSNEFSDFVKSSLRGISAGLNVSYHNLANDLTDVNYSSARIGELSDREVWKMLQDWIIESLLIPLFEEWLKMSLLLGVIKTSKGNSFPFNLEKFTAPSFQGRRWQWVDPQKEANAQKILIDNNLKSRSSVIREQGQDPEDVWLEIQRENDRMKELGIKNTEMPTMETEENENEA
ncbi:MAG: phage portal protein, partial [Gammaproteobacteria bacterium]